MRLKASGCTRRARRTSSKAPSRPSGRAAAGQALLRHTTTDQHARTLLSCSTSLAVGAAVRQQARRLLRSCVGERRGVGGADYLADAVFDMAYPGYRGGAMNHDGRTTYTLRRQRRHDPERRCPPSRGLQPRGGCSQNDAEPQETPEAERLRGRRRHVNITASVLDLGGEFAESALAVARLCRRRYISSPVKPLPSPCRSAPRYRHSTPRCWPMRSEAGADSGCACRDERRCCAALAHGNYAMSTAAKTVICSNASTTTSRVTPAVPARAGCAEAHRRHAAQRLAVDLGATSASSRSA